MTTPIKRDRVATAQESTSPTGLAVGVQPPAKASPAAGREQPPPAPSAVSVALTTPPRRPFVSPSLAKPLAERRASPYPTPALQKMRGLLDQAGVAKAEQDALRTASHQVDRCQANRLEHMTQITMTGGGQAECTAATLAVGTFEIIMHQPSSSTVRINALIGLLNEVRNRVSGTSAEHAQLLEDSVDELQALRAKAPADWTYGDVEQLQQAFYAAMFGEEALRGSLDGAINLDITQRYRDAVWGTARPTIAGVTADVGWLSDGTQGHCGLVANKHALDQTATTQVLFDPWPQTDGTSFNRGSDGPRLWTDSTRSERTEGRFLAADVDQLPR